MRTPARLLALLPAAALAVAVGAGPAAPTTVPCRVPGRRSRPVRPALPTGLTGVSFLVADLDSGDILAAKDAHHPLLPASTLKVLTALALLPKVPKYSTVTPTFDDVNIEGSRVGIIEKHQYPAYQIFRAMLMVSGNDAANALATAAGGQARDRTADERRGAPHRCARARMPSTRAGSTPPSRRRRRTTSR